MPQPKVEIQAMYRANQNIDVTVAAEDIRAGDTVLQVPEHLIITLKGVFEDEVSYPTSTSPHSAVSGLPPYIRGKLPDVTVQCRCIVCMVDMWLCD